MSYPLRAGLTGLIGMLTITVALPALETLDVAAHRALQGARGCGTEAAGWDLGLLVGLLLGGAALVTLAARPRSFRVAVTLAAIGSGAAVVEGAKALFERLRPDQMPYELVGNSFPSGHATNTTVIAIALSSLAWSTGSRFAGRLVTGIATIAILAQGLSRLLLGAHWATDVLASIALGVGWVGLMTAVADRPRKMLVAVTGGLAAIAVLVVFVRIPLRSPHHGGVPTASVDFERSADRRATRGPWIHGHREPIGAVTWLEGYEGKIALPVTPEPPREIRLALRPTVRGRERVRGCVAVELSIGDWSSTPITLFRGWREIRVTPPRSVWDVDRPMLRFRVLTDAATAVNRGDFGWVGVRWVRLYD